MIKIGIVTLYDANNMGAILQAFSLQETIKKLGHDVEFLRFEDMGQINSEDNSKGFEKSKKALQISEEVYNKDNHSHDVIVVGSDEVWNFKNTTFNHLEEFLGYNVNSTKVISYAPSSNGATHKEMRQLHGDNIDFSKFSHISVRDKGTQKLVKDISNIDAELVIDPTLLIESFEEYMDTSAPKIKDYIVLYGYEFSEEEILRIQDFARKNNKKVYSLAFKFDWCDTLECDIFEFLSYIKNADYLITNTFHGLMFSVILEKQFAIFSNNSCKILDFIKRFGIADRDAINVNDLSEIFKNKIDYEKVNKIKLEEREKSLNYLRKAIS